MSHHNEQPLAQVIQELLKVYKLESKLNEVKAINTWQKVVGPMISKHTLDLFIERKILFVKLDSDAIRNELSYAKSLIIKNINSELGNEAIVDVVFR